MKHKEPKVSYENFCRAFAGAFKKHAYEQSAYHTCYIREAIIQFVDYPTYALPALVESSSREELLGFRIAANLLRCGWPKEALVGYATKQQNYVKAVEDSWHGFLQVLERAGYRNWGKFAWRGNGLRHAWLVDGAPSLQPIIDELDEELRNEEESW